MESTASPVRITQAPATVETEAETGNEMLTRNDGVRGTGTVDISAQDQTDGRLTASVEAAAPGYVFLASRSIPSGKRSLTASSSRLCARTSLSRLSRCPPDRIRSNCATRPPVFVWASVSRFSP